MPGTSPDESAILARSALVGELEEPPSSMFGWEAPARCTANHDSREIGFATTGRDSEHLSMPRMAALWISAIDSCNEASAPSRSSCWGVCRLESASGLASSYCFPLAAVGAAARSVPIEEAVLETARPFPWSERVGGTFSTTLSDFAWTSAPASPPAADLGVPAAIADAAGTGDALPDPACPLDAPISPASFLRYCFSFSRLSATARASSSSIELQDDEEEDKPPATGCPAVGTEPSCCAWSS